MKKTSLLKRFFPYLWRYKHIILADLFCAALTTLCALVLPLIIRDITDRCLNNISSLTVTYVLRLGGLYLTLCVIDAIANYYTSSIGHIMGSRIETDMRSDLFSHLQRLSFSFYDEAKVGQLMSRMTNDLFDIAEFSHHCPEEFFIAGIKIIASFIILGKMDLTLTLIIFACLPVMLVIARRQNKKMRRNFRESRVQIGELNAQIEDSLLGIRVVQSFANEGVERSKFESGNRLFLTIKRVGYFYMANFHTTIRLFDGIMNLLVVVVGSVFVINGKIAAPDLIAYLLYVTTLITSIRRIVEFTEQFQRGMAGIERFSEVLDQPVRIHDLPEARTLELTRGEIRFENVSFGYTDGQEKVLKHIELTIKAGENIAIVGPSGGGKSTLCNLIPRFYEVQEGRILIDDQDIRQVTLQSLREQVGTVQQDVYLFSGTVLENILYGKEGATREEAIEAAKRADAHEFIEALPNGYDSYVGERGVKLSGGQKQRISIARTFLKNPPILILDEATSSLDNESEFAVRQSLIRLSEGRTTLTIAHRLSTVRNADRIFVLTPDGIMEEGTHDELVARGGLYSELCQKYS